MIENKGIKVENITYQDHKGNRVELTNVRVNYDGNDAYTYSGTVKENDVSYGKRYLIKSEPKNYRCMCGSYKSAHYMVIELFKEWALKNSSLVLKGYNYFKKTKI